MEKDQKITQTYSYLGYDLTITQDYNEKFDMGHHKYVIFYGGHIVRASESIGGPPRGKVNQNRMREILRRCAKDEEQWGNK